MTENGSIRKYSDAGNRKNPPPKKGPVHGVLLLELGWLVG